MLLCGNFGNYMLNMYSVKDFCNSNNLVEVAKKIRANSNGYLFITFIDSNNKALNIYLSRRLCEVYSEGGVIAKGFFNDKVIVETLNEEGETRLKLSYPVKDSQRYNLSELW